MHILRDWFHRHFSDPELVILALLLLVGTVLLWSFGNILAPVLASLVIAYLLEGIVGALERRRFPRMAAVLIVFLSFMAFLLFLIFALFPKISFQIGQAVSDLPTMFTRAQKALMLLPERYPELISHEVIADIMKGLQTGIGRLGQQILSFSLASVRGAIAVLVYLILMPLMVYFFLKDKEKIIAWVAVYLPENRKLSRDVWQEVDQQIGNYIPGKFWEILIIWGTSYVVFIFLGLRLAMLISLLVGLSVLVPYVGVTVTTLPVALAGLFQWGWTQDLFYLVLAYGVIQLLDGNLLAPLLLSEVVNMHPVAIISSVLLFGGIWGFWGVFFAIPLATLVHAVLRAWLIQVRSKDPPSEPPGGETPFE